MNIIKNIWNSRYAYAHILAVAATAANALGILILVLWGSSDPGLLTGGLLVALGLMTALCGYCLGGLWTAVKTAFSIGAWGFLVVPFPYSLVAAPVGIVVGLAVFCLIPVIPVGKALREHQLKQL